MPKKPTGKTAATRRLQKPKHKTFRLSRRVKQAKRPVPSSFRLLRLTIGVLKRNWKVFGIYTLSYLLLTLILVRNLSVSVGADEMKTALVELFDGGELLASATLFGILLSSSTATTTDAANVYQGLLIIIFTLAGIWLLRHIWSGNKTLAVRDAFYQGMYPLVPFTLVLFVIGLQLLPLYLAGFISGSVLNGIAVTALENFIWIVLFVLLIVLSLYLLSGSLFALFIATIPKTKPVDALKAAYDLVRFRRLVILRRLLFLPLILLLISIGIILPLVAISPTVAEWTVLLLAACGLPFSVTYLYGLYRGLL